MCHHKISNLLLRVAGGGGVRKTAKIDNSVHYVYLSVPQVSSSDKNNGTSREDRHIFMIISRSVLLRTRSVSDKSRRENQNNILCPITFFPLKLCRLR